MGRNLWRCDIPLKNNETDLDEVRELVKAKGSNPLRRRASGLAAIGHALVAVLAGVIIWLSSL